MNRFAVVNDGDFSGLGHFARCVRLGRVISDVVDLPLTRRQGGVFLGSSDFVDAARFVVPGFFAKTIEDLELEVPTDIDAAVSASLSSHERHEGGPELDMQLLIPKLLFGNDASRTSLDLR